MRDGFATVSSGSNVVRTIEPPVTVLTPYADVLSLKQCAAVSMTVGDNRVAEQENTPLSEYATYGCLLPSGWPPMIAPADVGSTAKSTAAKAVKASRKRIRCPLSQGLRPRAGYTTRSGPR